MDNPTCDHCIDLERQLAEERNRSRNFAQVLCMVLARTLPTPALIKFAKDRGVEMR